MAMWTVPYLVLCLIFLRVHCIDPCGDHSTCKQCIREPSCKWCSSVEFNKTQRCVAITTVLPECFGHIEDPTGSVNSTGYNREFSSDTQLKPQRFKIKLRPGEVQTFSFSFKAAENYPADLYFLLDSSNTMTEVLKTTADASTNIYQEMLTKTNNVLLGMGTFVDKNAAPFVREKLNPITSFRHILNMTKDVERFKSKTHELSDNRKENQDTPEGGFDALAQVIACEDEIGWRNVSRRIIFFVTDSISHTAGDGKAAGIVYPYDGKCYTKNGTYTKELELDYPSTAMINELAEANGVTVIFLVDKYVEKEYKGLKDYIQGSKILPYRFKAKRMKFANKDLEKIITQIYKEISQTIKFGITATSATSNEFRQDLFNVTFEPNCLVKNNPNCIVTQDEEKHFKGFITLPKYYGKDNINLDITVGNGINERITLDIEVVDCDCEIEKKSTYCSSYGTQKCGICECNKDRIGRKCECQANDNLRENDKGCRPEGDMDKVPCNGEGYCNCGICICNKGREGEFCECLTDSCIDKCNGHGKCYCGKCTCDEGWSGETCECHNKPCEMVNGKTCNGRGQCHCGVCKCNERAVWDARDSQNRETCEMKPCKTCQYDQCLKLQECASCRINNDQSYCSSTCGDIQVTLVDSLTNHTEENGTVCENMQVDLGCYMRYLYRYDDVNYKIHLLVQNEKDCLKSHYVMGVSVLVTLLVIGLVTILAWKLLTDHRDRREYQRFLKLHGAENDERCQNPIYEPATTTIRNPAFRKPSVDFTLK